jgi:carbonic anhydrase
LSVIWRLLVLMAPLPCPESTLISGAGLSQSPVNIATGRLAAYHGPPLVLRYEPSELGVENTGHVVEVMILAGANSAALIGGQGYRLVQYHFHAPAEHAVNGHLADVEGHFVHNNAQGATAVIGVFFRIGRKPNRVLDNILRAAPATAGNEVSAGEASPAELFRHIRGVHGTRGPVLVDSFYSSPARSPRPAAPEGVFWWVLADGGGVSERAVTRFHRVIARFPYCDGCPNNNRPVLPPTAGSSSSATPERTTDDQKITSPARHRRDPGSFSRGHRGRDSRGRRLQQQQACVLHRPDQPAELGQGPDQLDLQPGFQQPEIADRQGPDRRHRAGQLG